MLKICYVGHYGIRSEAALEIKELCRRMPCAIQVGVGRHLTDLHNFLVDPSCIRSRRVKLPEVYDKYLFIDQDVRFHADTVEAMIATGHHFVGAVHDMPDGSSLTAGTWGSKPGFLGNFMSKETPAGTYRVDWVSDSLLLVSREALETMERPWWSQLLIQNVEIVNGEPVEMVDHTSPEIGLCMNGHAHGIPIHAYRAPGISVSYEWAKTSVSPICKGLEFSWVKDIPREECGLSGPNA